MYTEPYQQRGIAGYQEEANPQVFKRCRYCGKEWRGPEDFVNDPDVYLAGKRACTMRPFMASVSQGLLLFVHRRLQCGSTLLISPDLLVDRRIV